MDFDTLLMIAATQGGGAIALTPGPELWPQPAFAASTGLTLLRSSVTGGNWVSDASGLQASATMTTPPAMSAGQQYQWSITIATNPASDGYSLIIGGVPVSIPGLTGTFSGTVTMTNSTANIKFATPDNGGAGHVSAFSVKLLS